MRQTLPIDPFGRQKKDLLSSLSAELKRVDDQLALLANVRESIVGIIASIDPSGRDGECGAIEEDIAPHQRPSSAVSEDEVDEEEAIEARMKAQEEAKLEAYEAQHLLRLERLIAAQLSSGGEGTKASSSKKVETGAPYKKMYEGRRQRGGDVRVTAGNVLETGAMKEMKGGASSASSSQMQSQQRTPQLFEKEEGVGGFFARTEEAVERVRERLTILKSKSARRKRAELAEAEVRRQRYQDDVVFDGRRGVDGGEGRSALTREQMMEFWENLMGGEGIEEECLPQYAPPNTSGGGEDDYVSDGDPSPPRQVFDKPTASSIQRVVRRELPKQRRGGRSWK